MIPACLLLYIVFTVIDVIRYPYEEPSLECPKNPEEMSPHYLHGAGYSTYMVLVRYKFIYSLTLYCVTCRCFISVTCNCYILILLMTHLYQTCTYTRLPTHTYIESKKISPLSLYVLMSWIHVMHKYLILIMCVFHGRNDALKF